MGLLSILVALAFILSYIIYRIRIRHLMVAEKMFPGPTSLPFFGNSLSILFNRNDLAAHIENLAWYYRRSIRFWLFDQLVVVLFDAEDVEKVFGSSEHIEKAEQYQFFTGWLGQGLLISHGEKWKKVRKILTPAFHFSILEKFIEIFHKNQTILLQKLKAKQGGNFDVYQTVKLYALDNICEAAMGTKVNAQLNPKGEYVQAIKSMCEVIFQRSISPWLWPNFIFNLTSYGVKQKKSLEVIHGLTKSVIAQRKEQLKTEKKLEGNTEETGCKRRKFFLDILLQSEEEGGLTDDEIQQEVDTFMFEGHDTISSAISFALYALSQHKHYQDKVYEESKEIFGDDDRIPTLHDLQSLKFLELFIKETLRLYPSVPMMARTLREDVVLDKRATLPKDSTVVVIQPIIHQHYQFWEKGDVFIPERFETEESLKRHPYQYLPFSAGPRNCIGQRFAMLELKSTLSRIVRNFELLPCNPDIPIVLKVDLILASKTGINIQITPRKD